jgi:hypothetical protein
MNSCVAGLQCSLLDGGHHLAPALDKAGIVGALVATLSHASLHCVAAAAGSLYLIDGLPGGQAVVGASKPIPALVRVLEKAHIPGDIAQEMGLGHRCAHECKRVIDAPMTVSECGHVCTSALVRILKKAPAPIPGNPAQET